VEASKDPATTADFLKKYVYDVPHHQDYLALFGEEHLHKLREPSSGIAQRIPEGRAA
jgi:hypothetical protein